MEVFLTELVKMLDAEDRRWRAETYILWDGAAYHTSPKTRRLLERLDVPVMQLGAYSYSMSPCELLFARLKTRDLCPGEIAVGKK